MIPKEFFNDDYANHGFKVGDILHSIDNYNYEICSWEVLTVDSQKDIEMFIIIKHNKNSETDAYYFVCSLDKEIHQFFLDKCQATKAAKFLEIYKSGKRALTTYLQNPEWRNIVLEYIDTYPEKCI